MQSDRICDACDRTGMIWSLADVIRCYLGVSCCFRTQRVAIYRFWVQWTLVGLIVNCRTSIKCWQGSNSIRIGHWQCPRWYFHLRTCVTCFLRRKWMLALYDDLFPMFSHRYCGGCGDLLSISVRWPLLMAFFERCLTVPCRHVGNIDHAVGEYTLSFHLSRITGTWTLFVYGCCIVALYHVQLRNVATLLCGMDFSTFLCWRWFIASTYCRVVLYFLRCSRPSLRVYLRHCFRAAYHLLNELLTNHIQPWMMLVHRKSLFSWARAWVCHSIIKQTGIPHWRCHYPQRDVHLWTIATWFLGMIWMTFLCWQIFCASIICRKSQFSSLLSISSRHMQDVR